MTWKVPEKYRVKAGPMPSLSGEAFGMFAIPSPDKTRVTRTTLVAIASPGMDGIEWEHVSVRAVKNLGNRVKNLTPTWDEMCLIKSLFWGDEDRVVQYHPERSVYVNIHPNVLHLYRPTTQEIPLPPTITV